MSKTIKKPLRVLRKKARLALDSPALVEIASSANSPNAAYELGYLQTGDVKMAMACQRLAAIKRDYGKEPFNEFVSSVVSTAHTQNKGFGQEQEEKNNE